MSVWEVIYYDAKGLPLDRLIARNMDELDQLIADVMEIYRRDWHSLILDFSKNAVLEVAHNGSETIPIMSWRLLGCEFGEEE